MKADASIFLLLFFASVRLLLCLVVGGNKNIDRVFNVRRMFYRSNPSICDRDLFNLVVVQSGRTAAAAAA